MTTDLAIATAMKNSMDRDAFPAAADWEAAAALSFCADWQGKNADSARETQVRLLWSRETLYLQFRARYREITVFSDAEPNGRRDHLWDRDVAEAFLQPNPGDPLRYKEFEVSPNGYWIDLEINLYPAAERLRNLRSGLARRVHRDEAQKLWTAELAIPRKALTAHFDPGARWRANFYRVEGPREPRFYSAWRPTGTPQPNFHIPESFGTLLFA